MYNLIAENPFLMNQKEIGIQTNKKGALRVYNEVRTQDCVYITSPMPRHIGTSLDETRIAENLGVDAEQISAELPLDIIDAGLRTLIVPIAALNDEIGMFPDEKALKRFCLAGDIDIVLILSMETADKQSIAHTRVFAPKFGYLEDPATGSETARLGTIC